MSLAGAFHARWLHHYDGTADPFTLLAGPCLKPRRLDIPLERRVPIDDNKGIANAVRR